MSLKQRIEKLQSDLASGRIAVDVPCGPDPFIALLGGIHARNQFHITHGKFQEVQREFDLIVELIQCLSDGH